MKGMFSTTRGSTFVSGSIDHRTLFHIYREFLIFLAINTKKSLVCDIRRHLLGVALSDICLFFYTSDTFCDLIFLMLVKGQKPCG
jgi:hypothetical protein